MDIILGTYADAFVPHFNTEQLTQFENLLQHNDPDLYNWITSKKAPPTNVNHELIIALRGHRTNSTLHKKIPDNCQEQNQQTTINQKSSKNINTG